MLISHSTWADPGFVCLSPSHQTLVSKLKQIIERNKPVATEIQSVPVLSIKYNISSKYAFSLSSELCRVKLMKRGQLNSPVSQVNKGGAGTSIQGHLLFMSCHVPVAAPASRPFYLIEVRRGLISTSCIHYSGKTPYSQQSHGAGEFVSHLTCFPVFFMVEIGEA